MARTEAPAPRRKPPANGYSPEPTATAPVADSTRGAWRQGQERDVGWDGELVHGVPSGLVEHEDGMGAWADLGGDFVEVPLHGLGVAAGQDEGGADAALGADGAEDVGRFGALIVRRPRPGAALGPAPRDLVLLADAGFVLPSDFYLGVCRQPGPDRFQLGGEAFLKSSTANSFCA